MRLLVFVFWILGLLSYVNGARLDRSRVDLDHDLADTNNDLTHDITADNTRNLKTILRDSIQNVDNAKPAARDDIQSDDIEDNATPAAIDDTQSDDIEDIEDNSNEIENVFMDSMQRADDNTADIAELSYTAPGVPLLADSDDMKEDGLSCNLRQTMAWEECDKKVVCDYTCQSERDCTFPYCNSLGLCECSPVFCKTDRMCNFFRIKCLGNFTCRNSNCYCD